MPTFIARLLPSSTTFVRAIQALLLLAIIVASTVMALLLVFAVEDLAPFLTANVLDEGTRQALLVAPLGSAVLASVVGLVFLKLKGETALLRLQILVRQAAPLSLGWAVPVLMSHAAWKPRPLEFLLLLTAFALASERTLRWSLAGVSAGTIAKLRQMSRAFDTRRGQTVLLCTVILGCCIYSVYFSYHTIQEHHRLTTGTLDLGIGDNLMANLLAGKPFRVPALLPDGSSMLKGHALFGALLYLPFYAIHPCSETLLVIQATLMGFAALPLYLFGSTQIPRAHACVLSYCYLLSPIVHGPNFYDFHFLSTAPIFAFCLYLGIAKRSTWITGLSWFVLVALREDLSLTLIPLGCVLAVSGVRVKTGLILAGASLVTFVVIKFVIMPAAGTWFFSDHYAGLYLPGHRSYGSAIVTILTNPALLFTSLLTLPKLIFTLHVFAPLLFVTWRNGWLFAATLGAFPSTLMVTNGPYITDIGFQYVTHWVPYVFAGAAVGLALMNRAAQATSKKLAAIAALSGAVLLHSWVFGAVLQKNTFSAAAKAIPLRMTEAEKADYQALVALRSRIPKEAVVAASPQMYPHISNRADAYDLENAHGNAEYLLLSPRSARKAHRTLRALLKEVPYGLVEKRGTIYLFQRGHESEDTRKAWAELGVRAGGR